MNNKKDLRELAIFDAQRRLKNVKDHIHSWSIIDKTHKNGDVEKVFSYDPTVDMILNMDFNTYGQLREIKYIVWRFGITYEELRGE